MINETAQAAYSEATNKEQEMECNCEHWQQCNVCKAKAEPTPHKHAAMVAEWIKDVWRPIERKMQNGSWLIDDTVTWQIHFEYRFADQVTPVKHEIVSSLSDEELCHPDEDKLGMLVSPRLIRRAIADAAAQKAHAEGYQAAIDAVCAMSTRTSLSGLEFKDTSLAYLVIAQFQADVKKLLGGV